MRRVVTLGFVTAVLAACSGAQAERVALSGQRETRSVPVGGFDRVELKGPDRVVVRVGGAQNVSLEGDRAVLEQMQVRVEDGRLIVERKGRSWSVDGPRERATVTVTLPRLVAASVGGSGEMSVDRVSGGEFAAAVGGSGDLSIGTIEAGKLEAAVGGSGDLQLGQVQARQVDLAIGGSGTVMAKGRADRIEAAIAGSGDIEAADLQTENAEVSIAGSGNANVYARTLAEISIVGSGDVVVHGGARCETSKMGSGSVRCGSGGTAAGAR